MSVGVNKMVVVIVIVIVVIIMVVGTEQGLLEGLTG